MASATITHVRRIDNYAAVQTLTDLEVQAGDTVTVSGVALTSFNATAVVLSTEPYYLDSIDDEGYLVFDYYDPRPNQIVYANSGADVEYEAEAGTLTYTVSVSWIVAADVLAWLGIDTATANDTAFVTTCVNASNAWCYRKRREAGYVDSASSVPSADVKLGATMYAATLYRERGSVDSFASFDSMAIGASPSATLGRIMQLLGCGRAQVA
jgi:hypothetical protein